MNTLKRYLQAYKFQRHIGIPALGGHPQPKMPKANIAISVLTRAGLAANGKGSKYFLLPFCQELRQLEYATYVCTSIRQIERILTRNENTIIINVFGEEHQNIASKAMIQAESKASVVFNRSDMGNIIADKQLSLEHFTKFGVPMPPDPKNGSMIFSNERKGSGLNVKVFQSLSQDDQDRYNRAMINTIYTYQGRSYYTSVRLMCIADQIFHAMVRASGLIPTFGTLCFWRR